MNLFAVGFMLFSSIKDKNVWMNMEKQLYNILYYNKNDNIHKNEVQDIRYMIRRKMTSID